MIPPKERERQCFLLNGVRESAAPVCSGCFSNCKNKRASLAAVLFARSAVPAGAEGTCLISFFFLADSGMLLTCW